MEKDSRINRLDRASLGSVYRVATGGQAILYTVPDIPLPPDDTWHPGQGSPSFRAIFKEYRRPASIDGAALEERVAFFDSLDESSRSTLFATSAWPLAVVYDHGTVCGYVMLDVPDQYRVVMKLPSGPELRVATVAHLLNPDSFLRHIELSLNDRLRSEILHDVGETLSFFHAAGIIVGDFSANNLLFNSSSRPKGFYLDCDSMRLRGRDVSAQVETVDWTLPTPREPMGTAEADVYKFGLLVIRLYSGSQSLRVLDRARLPPVLLEIAKSSLSPRPEDRPKASDWLEPLVLAAYSARDTVPRRYPVSIRVPAPVWHTVPLIPSRGSVDIPGAAEERPQRITIGEPIVLPLTARRLRDDPDLEEYMQQTGNRWRFSVVKLACSFYPDEDEPLLQAEVTAALRSSESDSMQPIAWSVDPRLVVDSINRGGTNKIATDSKFVVSPSMERSSSYSAKEYFLQALGERESDVTWVFRRTSSSSVTGTHTLTLVVRLPEGRPSEMHVRVVAYIERRFLGIVPYRAPLPRALRIVSLDTPNRFPGERYPGDP